MFKTYYYAVKDYPRRRWDIYKVRQAKENEKSKTKSKTGCYTVRELMFSISLINTAADLKRYFGKELNVYGC